MEYKLLRNHMINMNAVAFHDFTAIKTIAILVAVEHRDIMSDIASLGPFLQIELSNVVS